MFNRDGGSKATSSPFLSSCRRIGLSRIKKSSTSLHSNKRLLKDAAEPANLVDRIAESISFDRSSSTLATVNTKDNYHSNQNISDDDDKGNCVSKRSRNSEENHSKDVQFTKNKRKISRGLKTLSKDIDIRAVKIGRFNTEDFLKRVDLNSLEEKCLKNDSISEDVKQFICSQKNEESRDIWAERDEDFLSSLEESHIESAIDKSSDWLNTENSIDKNHGEKSCIMVRAIKTGQNSDQTTNISSSHSKITQNTKMNIALVAHDSISCSDFSETKSDSDSDFEQFAKRNKRQLKPEQIKPKTSEKGISEKDKSKQTPKKGKASQKVFEKKEIKCEKLEHKLTIVSDGSEDEAFCKKETKKRKILIVSSG